MRWMSSDEGASKRGGFDALLRALSDDPERDSTPSLDALDDGWEDEVIDAFGSIVNDDAPKSVDGRSTGSAVGAGAAAAAAVASHGAGPAEDVAPSRSLPKHLSKRERKALARAERAKAASPEPATIDKKEKAKRKADAAKERQAERRRQADERQKQKAKKARSPKAPREDRRARADEGDDSRGRSTEGASEEATRDLAAALTKRRGRGNRIVLGIGIAVFALALVAFLATRAK